MRPGQKLLPLVFALSLLFSACGPGDSSGLRESGGYDSLTLSSGQSTVGRQSPGPAGSARSAPSQPVSAPLAGGLSLPAPSSLSPRGSSFSQAEGHRKGSEYDATLPNSRVISSLITLGFAPDYTSGEPLGELSFALFSFTLPDAGASAAVNINWGNPPAASDLFVALANFDTDRWDWFKPASVGSFDRSDIAPYIDGADRLIMALAVTGSAPASLTDIQILPTLPPVADLQADVTSGTAPLSVSFDASASADPDGTIANYEWDFDGDGSFSESDNGEDIAAGLAQPTAQLYSAPGIFSATVRVTDDLGASSTAMLPIDVNGAPSVSLGADVTSGAAPLDVNFTATPTDDGTIVNYEWDFDGDGSFGEADNGEDLAAGNASALHTYSVDDSFEAAVRVTDDKGATASNSLTITVSAGGQPTVTLLADQQSGDKPLTVNFSADASDDGSITDYEWDFDGDGNYSEADNGEDSAQGSAGPSHNYDAVGVFEAAVRVTDNDSNQATDSITITVNNAAPLAELTANPTSGSAPLLVDLDASGSSDPGGSIADYQWDLDGDSNFNEAGAELDNQGQATINDHSFASSVTVSVQVTDDDGASDTDSVVITVSSWTIINLSTGANADGTSASMALIGGNPAIVYRRTAPSASLRYKRSSTATGSSLADWSDTNVVNGSMAVYGTSLAEVGGRAAVAYQNAAGALRYSREDGSGSFTSPMANHVTVETDTDTGRWPSLKVVNNNPALGYINYGQGNVIYVRSTTTDGTSAANWNGKVTVFDGTIAAYSDMQIVNGNPALAFCDNSGQILKFIRATTAGGDLAADWPAGNMCDVASGILATYSGLTTASSRPAIGYIDANADVRFARSGSDNGTSTLEWSLGTNVLVAGQPSVDYGYSRVNFQLGVPVFAYSNITDQNQHFSLSSNDLGDVSATWNEELVDGASTMTNEASNIILLSNGKVALCYHGLDNDDLLYAIRE